ncbi:hypothetical protein FRC0184_00100 [Corynebacterium diphtheriae]|nr:hypothetical protein FRC0184_00100 [Corynebacterium diphtheriae]
MDFSKSPVTSIVLNAPVNDYSAILTDFKFFDNPLFSHLSGKLLIGESMRNIKFGQKGAWSPARRLSTLLQVIPSWGYLSAKEPKLFTIPF